SSAEAIYYRDNSGLNRMVKGFTPRLDHERQSGITVDQRVLVGEASEQIRTLVGGWRIYHVHDTSSTSPMRNTAKVDDNRFLRPDGSNLAAFLFFLHEREEASYSLIRR